MRMPRLPLRLIDKVTVVGGLCYVGSVLLLYFRGATFTAAYLTMPAWLVVLSLLGWLPESVAMFQFWGDDVLLLVICAAINVLGVRFAAGLLAAVFPRR